VHVDAFGIEIVPSAFLGVPLNRTYFVMGVNPAPEYYRTNWSFANYMHINYLISADHEKQLDYQEAHQEHYNSTDTYHAITPQPGQTFNLYFGTAPFRPTRPKADSHLTLFDHLLKGYLGISYLRRETWALEDLGLIPTYEIYLDGVLVASGNLTNWIHTLFTYGIFASGTYVLNLSIPSNYPVWNFTSIQAKFEKPSTDFQPPFLRWLKTSPRFEEGRDYEVELKVEDNASIHTTWVFYRFDEGPWTNLTTLTNTTPLTETATYEGNFTVTTGAKRIDLKICVSDGSGNELNYTIIPIALPTKPLSIRISCPHNAVYITEGDITAYKLESPHPYPNDYNYTWRINQMGFAQIAVHFINLSVEEGYDWVIIKDSLNRTIARYTGSFEDLWTPSVEGDTLYVTLVSDSSINDYGFYIDAVLNGSVDESCEVVGGDKLYIQGLVRDETGKGVKQLRLEYFLNQSYEGRSKTSDGLFEANLDIPCNLPAIVNLTANFAGTGVYPRAEGKTEVRPIPLDFTINRTLPIHTLIRLNASLPGALLTINRTDLNWTWSYLMEKKDIEFSLHNYGNYSIKLNSTCEEVVKSVFVNITTKPNILSINFDPLYPIASETINAKAKVFDEAWHNVSLNISNETFWQVYDFAWLSLYLIDPFTQESYNATHTFWEANLANLEANAYDALIEVKDVAGFVINRSEKLYVYPPIDVTFNLTDWRGSPVERTIFIAFDHIDRVEDRIYDIVGTATITLPNVTYFAPKKKVSTHLRLDNHLLEEDSTQVVIFVNTTLLNLMRAITEHHKGKILAGKQILYLIYTYRPSWDYNSTLIMGSFNLETFNLLKKREVSASGEVDGYNHLCKNITLPTKSNIEVKASFKSINDTYSRIFITSLDCPESEGRGWHALGPFIGICESYGCSISGKYCSMGEGGSGIYSYVFEDVQAGDHRICVGPSSESGYLWTVDLTLTSFDTPAKLYTCAKWDFEKKVCTSGWKILKEDKREFFDSFLYVEGAENKTEAFALGEPQYCGDGYCNPNIGEDCSTCPTDCGPCPIPVIVIPPALAPPPVYVYDFSLSLLSRLEILPNESKTFFLFVKNVANGTLTNLTVSVTSEPDCNCTITIVPELVSALEANKSASFKVKIPAGIRVGEYLLIFNVSSNQLSKTTSLNLKVKELPEKAEASRLIAEAEHLIREKVEHNVTEAEKYLREAREAFAAANYVRAIEFARQAISAAEAAPPLPKPWIIPWWIIVVIVSVGTAILILFLKMRRREEITWKELYRKWA
jgi:hypothetical protein